VPLVALGIIECYCGHASRRTFLCSRSKLARGRRKVALVTLVFDSDDSLFLGKEWEWQWARMNDNRSVLGILGTMLHKLLPVILMDHELTHRDIRLFEIALSQACVGRMFHPVLRFDVGDTPEFGTLVPIWMEL
jgi:hypothetical protein